MIEIVLNGEKREIEAGLSIEALIAILDYHDSTFAVAVNGTFVPLNAYEKTVIKSGDEIEILAPMVGG